MKKILILFISILIALSALSGCKTKQIPENNSSLSSLPIQNEQTESIVDNKQESEIQADPESQTESQTESAPITNEKPISVPSEWADEKNGLYKSLNDKQNVKTVILKSYPNFFFEDFRLDIAVNGEDKATVTVVEKVGEFYTDNSYVLFYENGKYTEIYNRVVRELTRDEKALCKEPIKNEDKTKALKEAKQNAYTEYDSLEQIARGFFDIKTGKKYYQVFTKGVRGDIKLRILSYKYEL